MAVLGTMVKSRTHYDKMSMFDRQLKKDVPRVGLESTTAPSSAECSPRLSYLGVSFRQNLGIKVSFGTRKISYGFQITSGVLVRLLSRRAITNKRSDNRFRYFWHSGFSCSDFDSSTNTVSARLVVVRAKCRNEAIL